MRPLVARFGVLALVAAVACQAAQVPGPSSNATPQISYPVREATCTMRVTQSFTVANDLTCTGDGLIVAADNVTVDLGGHTLTGPGMGPQTWPLPQLDSVGVRAGSHTGVTIRNGKTTAFSTGIYFLDMRSSSIESVRTLRNRFGFYIHGSACICRPPTTVYSQAICWLGRPTTAPAATGSTSTRARGIASPTTRSTRISTGGSGSATRRKT